MNNSLKKIRYNITAEVVGAIATIVIGLITTGTTIVLANKSEAICKFSFNNNDYDDYVTIDPQSGTLRYNLIQNQSSLQKKYKKANVEYRIGYKATFQASYKNVFVILNNKYTSSGYENLVKQYGVRNYKVQLRRITSIGTSSGTLKLKVT